MIGTAFSGGHSSICLAGAQAEGYTHQHPLRAWGHTCARASLERHGVQPKQQPHQHQHTRTSSTTTQGCIHRAPPPPSPAAYGSHSHLPLGLFTGCGSAASHTSRVPSRFSLRFEPLAQLATRLLGPHCSGYRSGDRGLPINLATKPSTANHCILLPGRVRGYTIVPNTLFLAHKYQFKPIAS